MKKVLSDSLPWATLLVYGLAVIYAITGAVQVVRGVLDFESYGSHLLGFAAAGGLLGIGRGIAASKSTVTATATVEPEKAAARTKR